MLVNARKTDLDLSHACRPRRDSINFYQGYAGLHIVDLPGYGFAFAKEEKKEQWAALLQDFISTRAVLKRIYLLIDARHGMSRKSYCTVPLGVLHGRDA
jgi:GTP-binding protein EngB required for normal cell division